MKFDVVIGNPPYQEESAGTSRRDEPIYHLFYDSAFNIADKVCLISPARFLFNAGSTPKRWNQKMLNDKHIKVAYYEQNSGEVFQNTDIKGGVVILYRNKSEKLGPIGLFTHFNELNTIVNKVTSRSDFKPFSDIITNRGSYRYSDFAYEDSPEVLAKTSDRRLASNAFEKLSEIFYDIKPKDNNEYVSILGRENANRVYKWFNRKYLDEPQNFEHYKVIFPKANGSGAIGEVLSTPLIGEPLIGYLETFISAGEFDNKLSAENCLKYIKSKFARALLGALKITQENTRKTWIKVPMQDFTPNSDIDWTQSISEVDKQLYKKYDLSQEEIDFIETKVKEME